MDPRRRARDEAPPKKKVPTCKLRGDSPNELYLSTKKPVKQQQQPVIPPVQAPPQGEMLATEYVHNLQQQLYFLNAELRFLSDRSGSEAGPDGLSVDASIRRLRRACAMHEEETNKKMQEYEQQITELTEAIGKIDEERAMEVLNHADDREKDGLENLENAFVEMASEITVRTMDHDFYDSMDGFIESQKVGMLQSLDQQKLHLQSEQQQVQEVESSIAELRQQRKNLIGQFRDSIRSRRMKEEDSDVLQLLASEPERPPANVPITTINAKNAKIEMELKATLAARNEIEHQVDLLLEKNVRLKAELNRVNSQLETARYMKENMDKGCTSRYNSLKKASEENMTEIAALKRNRKDMKAEIQSLSERFNDAINSINKAQTEQQYNQNMINFYARQKLKIDDLNEQTKKEIHVFSDRICDLREELDALAHQIADAAEEKKSVQVLVDINSQDPRCVLNNPPAELEQLLESLTAVKQAIV